MLFVSFCLPPPPFFIISLTAATRRAAPSAEFSVDRTRHLMSLLTMLGPSPDWNVGLSGEDLCTKECGWVQRLVTDLIPWDAGTDSGVTYEVVCHSLSQWFKTQTLPMWEKAQQHTTLSVSRPVLGHCWASVNLVFPESPTLKAPVNKKLHE